MVGQRMLLKMLHCKGIRVKRVKTGGTTDSAGEGPSRDKGIRRVDFTKMNEYSTCRVCLKNGSIPIFGHDRSDYLSKGLNAVGGITVSITDPFPKFLCESCNELLQGAILLRRTAQQSDKLLNQPVREISESDRLLDCVEDIRSKYEEKNAKPPPTTINIKAQNNEKKFIRPKPIKEISEYDEKKDIKPKTKLIIIKQEKTDEIDQKPGAMIKQEGEKVDIQRINHCKRCNISFRTFDDLLDHKKTEEHANMKQICPVCNIEYSSRYFSRHLAVHKDEPPLLCDICGKHFLRQTSFNTHRLGHFYRLPYKCTLCPYKGRGKEAIKMHMRSHTGERPYPCTQCPSRFVNKSNLTKHMRVHSKVRAFQCDSCGKGFHTKQELETHIKVDHLGIKDHICSECGKEFGYRKQMMKHQLQVHKRAKLRSGKMPVYLKVEMMKEQENISVEA